jgi:hypothetical protein
MDSAGQLFVRDELADKPTVQYLRFVFSDKPRKANQMPGREFETDAPRGGRRRGP